MTTAVIVFVERDTPHAAVISSPPHQLCHGNNSDDRRRVLLEGSARASKDASKILEALLKPSIATVTADLAAGIAVVVEFRPL